MLNAQTPLHPTSTEHIPGSRWHASLKLRFAESSGNTAMIENTHKGPLRVQRTFLEQDQSRHVYLLHPPGGYVGGDIIDIDIETRDTSHVVATSPAANKFYRCANDTLFQDQTIQLRTQDGSLLEWLPQETIFFRGANARLLTTIDISDEASFIGWEINCLGRTASGEQFDMGQIDQTLTLTCDSKLLYRERLHINQHNQVLNTPWGLNDCTVFATLVAKFPGRSDGASSFDNDEKLTTSVNYLREVASRLEDADCWSMTHKSGVLLVRYLGHQSELCKHGLSLLRTELIQRFKDFQPAVPRIWAT